MSWDRKAERSAKFHKNKKSKNKQKSKSYIKEKKELRDTNLNYVRQ